MRVKAISSNSIGLSINVTVCCVNRSLRYLAPHFAGIVDLFGRVTKTMQHPAASFGVGIGKRMPGMFGAQHCVLLRRCGLSASRALPSVAVRSMIQNRRRRTGNQPHGRYSVSRDREERFSIAVSLLPRASIVHDNR